MRPWTRAPDGAAGPHGFPAAAAVAIGAVAAAVTGAVVAGLPGASRLPGSGFEGAPSAAFYASVTAVTGLVVVRLRPHNAVGWLLLLEAACLGLATGGQAYGAYGALAADPRWSAARWIAQLTSTLWLPTLWLHATALPLLYPDGRVGGRFGRRVLVTALAAIAALCVAGVFSAGFYEDVVPGTRRPVRIPSWIPAAVAVTCVPALFVSLVAAWYVTVRRLLRSSAPERRQRVWLVAAVVPLLPSYLLLDRAVGNGLAVLLPIAIAVGIFRHNLFGVEVVLRRGIVYGALTAAVVATYLLVVTVAGGSAGRVPVPGVLAAAAVAVGLTPARDRLQGAVDRFLYGDRRDPMRAVTALAGRVAQSGESELLPAVLGTVTAAVQAPAAAVIAPDGRVIAQTAVAAPAVGERLQLTVAGVDVGTLVVAPRSSRDRYSPADRALLTSLAPQVAAVVRALDLTEALERERDHVIDVTRRERERYRRDLHDGLGPSLSGIRLSLQVAVDALAAGDTARAARIVEAARLEAGRSVGEVRRVIDDLRPGVLDETTLAEALRRHGAALAPVVSVRVQVAAGLPTLLPDVEAAVYRIVAEALTNVVRHAGASRADVEIAVVDGVLRVVVRDDGRGLSGDGAHVPYPRRPGDGLGLPNMRRRATALGGELVVADGGSGAVVTVRIPVARPDPRG